MLYLREGPPKDPSTQSEVFTRAFNGPYTTLASERADCKPINSAITNSWVYAETH